MTQGPLGRMLNHIRGLVRPPGSEPSDGQLLQRFAASREEASFAALVQRHGGLVLGVCRRVLADEHDAEDAFQATFLVLARKATSIRKQESVASWLYGVAYRLASKARLEAARRRRREQEVVPLPATDPIAEVVWRELRPVLDEELNRLPARYRDPVVLCYLENQTQAEAARQLGWSKGTVSGRLARARELLRARLTRRGLSLSGAVLVAALGHGARAAVPAALGLSTVKVATLSAAGSAATAGVLSAPVTALAEGALYTMWLTKLKFTAALLFAVTVAGISAALVGQQALGQKTGARAAELRKGDQASRRARGDAKAKEEDETARLREENQKLKEELAALRRELARWKRIAAAQTAAARAQAEAARRAETRARLRAEQARRRAEEQSRQALKAAEKYLEHRKRAEGERDRARAAAQAAEKALRDAEIQRKLDEGRIKKAVDQKKKTTKKDKNEKH